MTVYATEQADALADITEAGGAVTFTRASSSALYDPLRGGFAPTADSASGFAIARVPRGGDAERFAGLDLVTQRIRVLVVAASGLAFAPAAGMKATFADEVFTVRDVAELNVNGAEPILYFVAVSV